ncbi:MAG: YegS/Rv2252/BmrU family lipid kinase [Flavobacteriales bacterium]|jgi:diacylglycerol kinase (ATP)|tara:strand:- start:1092 stop:1979 length:888 start_codon:yes stop_codon:yes gene_type:complete
MTKQSIHFIINPISGTGKQANIEEKISQELDSLKFDTYLHYTTHKGHATEIAKQLVAEKAGVVVAVGGDGTVNEVAQAMVSSSSILGIIPTGSGNGLARHLSIPQNVSKALRLINTLNTKEIDSCTANEQFFMNVSGIGYDAHISHCFASARKRGMKTYVKLILSEWWTYSVRNYKISINNTEVFNGDAVQVSFANGTQFGNNVIVSPESIDDDGEIELCILRPFNFYEIPHLLLALATRRFHLHNRVQVLKCSSATIISNGAKSHLDGEPKELGNSVVLKVLPKSIRVITNKLV